MSGLVSPPRNSVAGIFVYSTTRPRCEESRSQSLEPRPRVFQTQLFEAKRLFSMDVRWFSKAVFKSVTSNEPHSCSSNQSLRFHNHCNYIVVLGIGVTWHSHMSNASKGCHEISLAPSCQVTQDPGEDASTRWRCGGTKLGACTLLISITPSSLQRSDPPRPLQNTWTREGLNPPRGRASCEGFTSARNLRCDRSLLVPEDCPKYIPEGKPTPASKLAFVNIKDH